VARNRQADTKAQIQAVARDLFARQGIQQTSLREIADRLGITKAALYYHFESREALVQSIVEPLVGEMETFVATREAITHHDSRTLLGDYFDLLYRHHDVISMLVHDLSTMSYLDMGMRMFEWRRRLMALLLGPAPTLAARARAVVAIGGLSDCTVEFPDVPIDEIKTVALEAACAALSVEESKAM